MRVHTLIYMGGHPGCCFFYLHCPAFHFLQEDIISTVKDMLRKFGVHRYIANLGHGMHPDHEPEKLATFVDTVHSYSATLKEASSTGSLG